MELPAKLRAAVDQSLEGVPTADLQRASSLLSQRYRAELRDGRLHLDDALAVKAYLAARLPATFAAVRSSMEAVAVAAPDFLPATQLDLGSGPGTAFWAAQDCWDSIASAQLVELSDHARNEGIALAAHADTIPEWIAADVTTGIPAAKPADLVTIAYVLDEMSSSAMILLAERAWTLTRHTVLIIEPGTPAGWNRILTVRNSLMELGAHILAPCPHQMPCPLAAPDWCHFAQRVARSRIHKATKNADVPWEDEKFIYLAASRQPVATHRPRVLAPPRQSSGQVRLKLCQPNGSAHEVHLSKRDGDAYRSARRAGWGDSISAPDP